jgi:RNA polymerase sigma-70 factor (ECF subfamily)
VRNLAVSNPATEPDDLLRRLRAAEPQALGELFARHRDRLRAMVALRLDRRLRGRLDPSDVLQEAFLEATARAAEWAASNLEPYLWLRLLTFQRLLILHRHHLEVQARAAGRQVSLEAASGEVTAEGLAELLADSGSTPSRIAARHEAHARLHQALASLEPLDREVLALRHFEQLSNAEAAQVLGIQAGAASQRYYRALKRLKDVLADPGD